jgi:hypothetical protein
MEDKIGIIYSPGFGAGWSTWGEPEQALDQELAHAIENLPREEWIKIAEKNWPDAYKGGLSDREVEWVEKGTAFSISDYDGSESIEFGSRKTWSYT